MSCKRRCALRSNQPSNAGSTHSRRNQCGRLSQFSKSISTLHFWCPAAGVAPGRRALDEEHALGTFDVAGDRGMPQIGEGGRVLAAELIMPPAFRVFPSRTLNRSPCLVIFYAATHCVSAAARKPTPDRVPDPNLRWRWLTFACTKIILNGFHPSLGSTGIAGIERNARSTVFRKRSCRSCKPTKKPKSSWLTVPKMGSGSPRPTGPIPRRGTRNSIPALSVSTTSAVTQCRRLRTGLPVISMPAGLMGCRSAPNCTATSADGPVAQAGCAIRTGASRVVRCSPTGACRLVVPTRAPEPWSKRICTSCLGQRRMADLTAIPSIW